jgi:hypothetical protein
METVSYKLGDPRKEEIGRMQIKGKRATNFLIMRRSTAIREEGDIELIVRSVLSVVESQYFTFFFTLFSLSSLHHQSASFGCRVESSRFSFSRLHSSLFSLSLSLSLSLVTAVLLVVESIHYTLERYMVRHSGWAGASLVLGERRRHGQSREHVVARV